MSLLVVGTLCIDTIETPHGRADRVLGGSGAYAATAAALFGPVGLVAPVGDDFPAAHLHLLAGRGIDLSGVHTVAGVRSQYWHGRYLDGLRQREHVAVALDILDRWSPHIPDSYRDSPWVLLAHMPPRLQLAALEQLRSPRFVIADSIDYWIQTRRAEVERVLGRVDAFVINEQEAALLTGEDDVPRAARAIRSRGPRYALIKRGEAGAFLDAPDGSVAIPAFPPDRLTDTTGAGDTFAGALLGHLRVTAPHRPDPTTREDLRRSAVYGSATASFTVEGFGLAGLLRATRAAIEDRIARHTDPSFQAADPTFQAADPNGGEP